MAAKKSLGLWTCTALVMGNMIGSGIFLLPAALAVYGGISIVGWLLTSAGALMLALVFSSAARRIPRSGGPYAYTRAGLGDFAGFLVAWGYWISLLTGNAAISVAMVSYASVFWPVLATSPIVGALTAIAAVTILSLVNARGLRQAGAVQLVTTILKLLPLLAIIAGGSFYFNASHFQPMNVSDQSAISAITATAALTLWAFMGLESATIPAEDVVNPETTIPRATVLGTVLTTLIYVAVTIVVMGIVSPAELAVSNAPFADAAARIWGTSAAKWVAAGAAISCFGALNGWILNTGQIPAAAARDGVFPRFFGRRTQAGTPAASLALSAVIVWLLIFANYTRGLVGLFTFAILLSTLSALIPYAFTAGAQMVMVLRDGRKPGAVMPYGLLLVAISAFVYVLWAIGGAGQETVYWGFLLLLCGVPVFAVMKARQRQ